MLSRGVAITSFVALLLAGLALVSGRYSLSQPLDLPDTGYTLNLAPGTSLQSLSAALAEEGVLAYPRTWMLYGRLSGKAGKLKAGEYEIAAGSTAFQLLEQLVNGRVRLHALTIIEGWSSRELLAALRGHPALKQTLPEPVPADLHNALALSTGNIEGWFFPDTYHFARGTTDIDLLVLASRRMKQMLDQAWDRRREDLPIETPYEALILASIVEKETALGRERARIAGVFMNRLRKGMRLQTDPSVIYGLGEAFDGNLTRRHLESNGPYNTYMRDGLPPTPISLPGAASLLAVVQPEDTDALFFVASGEADGSHVFSRTLSEHNAAVGRYLEVIRSRRR